MKPSYITTNENFSASFPIRYLKACSFFMAPKDVRYYLQGVHIKNGMIEASDGHIAIRITSSDILVKGDESFILSADYVKQSLKGILKRDLGSIHYAEGESVELINGRFPDMSRVLINPDDTSGEVAQFNPELLVRVQKAYKTLWPKKNNVGAFELRHNGNRGAVVKNENASETVHCIVMPWRV